MSNSKGLITFSASSLEMPPSEFDSMMICSEKFRIFDLSMVVGGVSTSRSKNENSAGHRNITSVNKVKKALLCSYDCHLKKGFHRLLHGCRDSPYDERAYVFQEPVLELVKKSHLKSPHSQIDNTPNEQWWFSMKKSKRCGTAILCSLQSMVNFPKLQLLL